jgi:hypothetical protein
LQVAVGFHGCASAESLGLKARVKKLGIIAGVIAFAIFAVAELVHDFLAGDPVEYFRREPSRLLYVAAIAIAGGLLTLSFQKLPPRAKRLARNWGLGAAATVTTAGVGFFTYILFSLASMISKFGGSIWSAVAMCLPTILLWTAITAYCWFTCWRLWKKESAR